MISLLLLLLLFMTVVCYYHYYHFYFFILYLSLHFLEFLYNKGFYIYTTINIIIIIAFRIYEEFFGWIKVAPG